MSYHLCSWISEVGSCVNRVVNMLLLACQSSFFQAGTWLVFLFLTKAHASHLYFNTWTRTLWNITQLHKKLGSLKIKLVVITCMVWHGKKKGRDSLSPVVSCLLRRNRDTFHLVSNRNLSDYTPCLAIDHPIYDSSLSVAKYRSVFLFSSLQINAPFLLSTDLTCPYISHSHLSLSAFITISFKVLLNHLNTKLFFAILLCFRMHHLISSPHFARMFGSFICPPSWCLSAVLSHCTPLLVHNPSVIYLMLDSSLD